MTLAESKMTKMLVLKGTFTEVDSLTKLWFKIYPVKEEITLNCRGNTYRIGYKGEFYKGLYVLGTLVDAIRKAKAECHIEVSCCYE